MINKHYKRVTWRNIIILIFFILLIFRFSRPIEVHAATSDVYWKYNSSTGTLYFRNTSASGYSKNTSIGVKYKGASIVSSNWSWNSSLEYESIKKVIIETSLKPDSLSGFLAGCSNLVEIQGSEKIDTSNTTGIYGSFYKCRSLTSIDVSKWNTANVIDMESSFEGCSSLKSIDVSKWNTAKVIDIHYMFEGCSSLTSIDVSKWVTSNVTNMSDLFANCSSLKSINVSNWNTAKVKYMEYMFTGCRSLTSITFGSNWNTANVKYMRYMFAGCSSLKSVNVSNWNTVNVTEMTSLFEGCSSLTSIDVSKWNTANVTDMKYLFKGCSSLKSIDVSKWNTSEVLFMESLFHDCSSLTSINVSNWNTVNVATIDLLFCGCSNLTSIDLSSWNISKRTPLDCTFYKCTSLLELKTPKACVSTIKLPHEMVERNGTTVYTEMPTKKTLYKAVTVSYDYKTNGGSSSSITSEKRAYNVNFNLVATAAKSGYTFVGWNTNKNATTKLSSYTLSGSNVTFYAIFSKSYKGTFKDYISAQQSRSLTTTFYNNATSGTVTAPTGNQYSGWEWRGWSSPNVTTANAAVAYSNGSSITLSSDQTFYGLYQKTTTINYDSNGGPTASPTTGTFYFNAAGNYQNPSVSIPNVTRNGYQLLGWANTKQGANADETKLTVDYKTDTDLVTLMKSTNGSKTIYAVWKLLDFNIKLDPDNGESVVAHKVRYGTGYGITHGGLPTPEKKDHVFTGWYKSKTRGGALIANETNVDVTSEITLYAHWNYVGKYTSASINENNDIALVGSDGNVYALGVKGQRDSLIKDGKYKEQLNITGVHEAEYVNGNLNLRVSSGSKTAKVDNPTPTFTSTSYLWNGTNGVIGDPGSKFGSVQGTCIVVDTNNKSAIYKFTKDNVDRYKLVEN